jgi:hypothetical protein
MPSSPRWLDVVRHRIRGFRAPFLLIVQHHDIPASTLLAAPVTVSVNRDFDVLAPRLVIRGTDYLARLLDISAVPRGLIAETILSVHSDAGTILDEQLPSGHPDGYAA